jgi:hypothetical protein
MGVEEEPDGEDNVAEGYQLAGTTIDIIVAEPHIIVQQYESYQEIHTSC